MAKRKKSYFFDFLNQICFTKNENFYSDETSRDWNTFMILRYLSMDESLVDYINVLQPLQENLTDKQFYILLCSVIPKKKRFLKYIKGVTPELSDNLKWISRYYKCSQKESQEYVDILGESWSDDVCKMFGEKTIPKKTRSLKRNSPL